MYYQALQGYPGAAVEQAARAHVGASKYWPTVAELVAILRAAEGPDVTPEAAWEEVQHAIRRYGPYQPHPPWSHPAIERAVEAVGGYVWLCACDGDQLGVARAHFYRHVEAALTADHQAQQCAPVRAALQAARAPAALPAAPPAPAPPALAPPAAPPLDAQALLAEIRTALSRLGQWPADRPAPGDGAGPSQGARAPAAFGKGRR